MKLKPNLCHIIVIFTILFKSLAAGAVIHLESIDPKSEICLNYGLGSAKVKVRQVFLDGSPVELTLKKIGALTEQDVNIDPDDIASTGRWGDRITILIDINIKFNKVIKGGDNHLSYSQVIRGSEISEIQRLSSFLKGEGYFALTKIYDSKDKCYKIDLSFKNTLQEKKQ